MKSVAMQKAYNILSAIEDAKSLAKLRSTPYEYTVACGYIQMIYDLGEVLVLAKSVADFFESCGFTVIPPHDCEVCYTVIDVK